MVNFLTRLFSAPEIVAAPEAFWSVPDSDGSMPPTIAPPSRKNVYLTPDLALTLGAVYRSAQIISTVCSDLPLIATRSGEVIDTPSLAVKPDIARSYQAFIKRAVIDLALHGNAYFLKTINDRGAVTNLAVLDPNLVSINWDDAGRKFYEVSTTDGKVRKYGERDIKHLRLLEVPGKVLGLGPIQAARIELTNAVNVRNFASNWYDAGNGVPLGTLNTDQELDGEDVEAYISGWYEMLSQGKTAVLSKGLKYEPLALSPEDLQWLGVQRFTKTEISTLFGIPPTYLNAEIDSTGFTYSNLSQIDQVFYRTTLRAYLSELEAAISECLPNRVEVRFDLRLLLRADDKSRFEAYNLAIAGGYMTADYVAELEGLPTPPKPVLPAPSADQKGLDLSQSDAAQESEVI